MQKYLGHDILQITMDLYTSVMPQHMESEMNKLADAFDVILQSGANLVEEQYKNIVYNAKITVFVETQ